MSKAIAAMALVIGGAATYAWLQKNGDAGHLHSHVEGAVNKVRSALSNDDPVTSAGAEIRDKANDLSDDVADRLDETTA
jgi:hypothetical protein